MGQAYIDKPLPIPHGQVTTQPSLVARMLEALELDGSERALEVGTGYGFQTALLARLAREVVSVERFEDLARTARENLERHGAGNVDILVGDGSAGVPERAPFAVVVAVHGKGPTTFDAGRAAQNMMLAAWDLGVGSCPNGMPDRAAAAEILGLREGEVPAIIVSFG